MDSMTKRQQYMMNNVLELSKQCISSNDPQTLKDLLFEIVEVSDKCSQEIKDLSKELEDRKCLSRNLLYALKHIVDCKGDLCFIKDDKVVIIQKDGENLRTSEKDITF